MYYKRILIVGLAAAITLTVSACGGTDDTVIDVIYDNDVTVSTTKPAQENPASAVPKEYETMYESDLVQFRIPDSGDTVVTLLTNYGEIDILMFPEQAPKTVENFVTHGQNNYYDGVTFHRIINDFMIQGGDPKGTGRGGESIWGKSFEDEFSDDLFPVRGALAMANSGSNSNGSQFFIVQSYMNEDKANEAEGWAQAMADYGFDEEMINAYRTLGGTPFLFNKHTVFGQVVNGMDVVDAIAAADKNENDKPIEDIIIEDIVITVIE